MGTPGGEENPSHRVSVDSFYIAPFEVTVSTWREFTDDQTDLAFKWSGESVLGVRLEQVFSEDTIPISHVTWFEAIRFCNWLSRQHGLRPAYEIAGEVVVTSRSEVARPTVTWIRDANGFRLPTEAEWEFAARGGHLSTPTLYAGSDDIDSVAWYAENSGGEPHAIGRKMANELEAFDMTGNVGEWCWDHFDSRYYAEAPTENPSGPKTGYDPRGFSEDQYPYIHSVRGGGWLTRARHSTVSQRLRQYDLQRSTTGIRLFRNAE